MAIRPDGKIVFAEDETSAIHLLDPATSKVTCVQPAVEGIRYGDFAIHPTATQWIIAIKEDHREATPETQATHVHNTLVAIDLETGKEMTVAQGDDFYSHPKFDSSGKYVSWIQWSHPDMPWTGTVLYFAEWDSGVLKHVTRIAGQAQQESIAQPKWGLDGMLYFTSDRTGFWQLYSFNVNDHSVKSLSFPELEKSDFAIAEWKLGRYLHSFRMLYQQTDPF
jgi:tricorn protease-like protein